MRPALWARQPSRSPYGRFEAAASPAVPAARCRSRVAILFEVKVRSGFGRFDDDGHSTRVRRQPRSRRSSRRRGARTEIEGGDVVLIDTREPHEYEEAHLEGGKLVPPGLLADEIADARARHVAARRSSTAAPATAPARAAEQLQALGYENVASMAGGILAWQEQGLPVVAAEGMTPEQRTATRATPCCPRSGSRAS